jgi:hypothetical protein
MTLSVAPARTASLVSWFSASLRTIVAVSASARASSSAPSLLPAPPSSSPSAAAARSCAAVSASWPPSGFQSCVCHARDAAQSEAARTVPQGWDGMGWDTAMR